MTPLRAWKRIAAIGCTHGDHVDWKVFDHCVAFMDRYKAEHRIHLGDVLDTAAFRSGAKGTKDEARPIAPDYNAGIKALEKMRPTVITWGNHDVRLLDLMDHPSAIVSMAAGSLWNELQSVAKRLKAKTVPYDIEDGWIKIGGHYWGHGYQYNESAVRDTAEMLGGPVVMAHLHRPLQERGRMRMSKDSFCVGLQANPRMMSYARRRRATTRWGHGCVWGEVCETKTGGYSKLWLSASAPGQLPPFPL